MSETFGIHRISDIYHRNTRALLPDGSRWVAAVARPYPGTVWTRIRSAWAVLRGRAEALRWPEPGELEAASIRPPFGSSSDDEAA